MSVAQSAERTLRERCTSHFRAEIIAGSIKPGEHLVETRLSAQVGVSRGTLREALRTLQNEGLVVDDGRGHLLVRNITTVEIDEVFVVRSAIEALASSLLCEREDRVEVASRLRETLPPPTEDRRLTLGEQIDADLDFHELMCALTRNSTLLHSWRSLTGQIKMTINAAGPEWARYRMRHAAHVMIADAIAGGDAAAARAAIETHLSDFWGRRLRSRAEQAN